MEKLSRRMEDAGIENAEISNTVVLLWTVEVEELEEELEDWREASRKVMAEECAPDEKHCTCVPFLRKELEQIKRAFALNLAVHSSVYDKQGLFIARDHRGHKYLFWAHDAEERRRLFEHGCYIPDLADWLYENGHLEIVEGTGPEPDRRTLYLNDERNQIKILEEDHRTLVEHIAVDAVLGEQDVSALPKNLRDEVNAAIARQQKDES